MMKTAREILNKLGGYDWDVDEALRDLDALVPKKEEGYIIVDSTTKNIYISFENKGYMKGRNQVIDEMHKIFKGDK